MFYYFVCFSLAMFAIFAYIIQDCFLSHQILKAKWDLLSDTVLFYA